VSERQKYHMVERYRLDTWAFVAFLAIFLIIAHI
jgi:hypothetical protein